MMPQTTPPPVGLCVQDLTVRYGTAAVLQGVSFSVPVSGQLIGLLGVNGSGKTTLLKAAAGLLPHTGQCLLDGVPLESLSTRRPGQQGRAGLPDAERRREAALYSGAHDCRGCAAALAGRAGQCA